MTDIAMFTIDDDNVVRLSLKNITRTLSGPEEAVQLVCYALFTNPGSNFFARQDGGGLLESFIGQNITSNQQFRADVAIVLRKAMETIKQAQKPGRAANATVLGLDLVDAYSEDDGRRFIKIKIRLLTGNSFNVTIPGQVQ